MTVLFRVDASIHIGSGHVMRCLALADYLKSAGHECIFLCRAHEGNLGNYILNAGHQLYLFRNQKHLLCDGSYVGSNIHSKWLGVHWMSDAKESLDIIRAVEPQWLIVDHYALANGWEAKVRPFVENLMVIDDLADRKHECDILLDQTFAREAEDYAGKVPAHCKVLSGPQYSILRQEFFKWREASLRYRETAKLSNILINLGGVDKDNFTSRILMKLKYCDLPKTCTFTVVMGAQAPWISNVKSIATEMPWKTKVRVGVRNMAKLMSNADLAIGAAGSTTWERCCLGLPTIQLAVAKDQVFLAEKLQKAGVVKLINKLDQLPNLLDTALNWMPMISKKCRLVTDGKGVERVVAKLAMKHP